MKGESSVGRWLAEAGRRPGARLIWASTAGLAVLALATFYVSFRAQFTFTFAVKHQDAPALIEALIADVAMVICSMLALGMACAGQPAKAARLLVVVFAALSAGMNYLAADASSFRSVAVYVMPPVVFAVCTDQTVAVIRRHGRASPKTQPGPCWAGWSSPSPGSPGSSCSTRCGSSWPRPRRRRACAGRS
jgi:hypothetical protein